MCLASPQYALQPLTPEHTPSNRTVESSPTVSKTPVSTRCVTSRPARTVMSNGIATAVLQRPDSTTALSGLGVSGADGRSVVKPCGGAVDSSDTILWSWRLNAILHLPQAQFHRDQVEENHQKVCHSVRKQMVCADGVMASTRPYCLVLGLQDHTPCTYSSLLHHSRDVKTAACGRGMVVHADGPSHPIARHLEDTGMHSCLVVSMCSSLRDVHAPLMLSSDGTASVDCGGASNHPETDTCVPPHMVHSCSRCLSWNSGHVRSKPELTQPQCKHARHTASLQHQHTELCQQPCCSVHQAHMDHGTRASSATARLGTHIHAQCPCICNGTK